MAQEQRVSMAAGRVWSVLEKASTLAVLVASATIVIAGASLLWPGQSDAIEPGRRSSSGAIEDVPMAIRLSTRLSETTKGHADAKIAVIEFADFQCPFCARYATGTHRRLEQEYVDTGIVRYSFRNLPLTEIHPSAIAAAQAAECAGEQGRYWHMYDRLFANPMTLDMPGLLASGRSLGLDQKRFSECLDGRPLNRIQADVAEARRLQIRSTPTFLLGHLTSGGEVIVRKIVRGAHPPSVFKAALDELDDERKKG